MKMHTIENDILNCCQEGKKNLHFFDVLYLYQCIN